MKQKRLGSSGISVSEFTLGTWPFSGDEIWGEQSDQDSISAVHAALDVGINFFDTAEAYGDGRSEEVLARALSGRRDDAVIATKTVNMVPEELIASCEGSLRRLGTDHIDLYIVHWPKHDVPFEQSAATLLRLKEQGKIRAIGVSNFGVVDLNNCLAWLTPDVNQLPYNLLWRPIEHEILPLLRPHGVGLMVYSPLAQGLLTGRYANADDVPEGLARSRLFSSERPKALHNEPGLEDEMFAAIEEIKNIAASIDVHPAHASLAWVRRQERVTTILVGARSAEEVHLNVPAFDLNISDEVAKALEDATREIKRRIGVYPDMWQSEADGRYR